jgi:hypothetical protein
MRAMKRLGIAGKLRYGDDFVPIISALYETADKLAVKADGRPWKDDEPAQVKRRRKTAA